MDLSTFIQLQNECRLNAGIPAMTPEEELADYQEYLEEEERKSRFQ
ncbi:MAG: hypothetical protein MRJ68_19125 [Nitrospira sp.]|nr:hypothetical protein [Nitrospira sp.]